MLVLLECASDRIQWDWSGASGGTGSRQRGTPTQADHGLGCKALLLKSVEFFATLGILLVLF